MLSKKRTTEASTAVLAASKELYDLADSMRADLDYPLEVIVSVTRESQRLRTIAEKMEARGYA